MPPRVSTEERLRRILAMVPWVVAHDGPTVDEVCARFGCTPTELAADIELLYLCGLHPYTPDTLIEAEITDGRVWISYADYFSKPLQLTPAEGLRLLAAASTLLATPGTDPDGPLARGLAKLANVVGGADAVDVQLGRASQDVIERLREAGAAGEQVELDYYAFGRDERSRRTVEPGGVFAANGQWYLSAYCHTARGERLFRVDRILAVERTGRARTHPPVAAASELFQRPAAGGVAVLDVGPEGRWVAEQYPVDEAVELPGGGLRVRLAVSEPAWLDRLVLRLGPRARVVEGPDGWGGVAAAASRVLARYR